MHSTDNDSTSCDADSSITCLVCIDRGNSVANCDASGARVIPRSCFAELEAAINEAYIRPYHELVSSLGNSPQGDDTTSYLPNSLGLQNL